MRLLWRFWYVGSIGRDERPKSDLAAFIEKRPFLFNGRTISSSLINRCMRFFGRTPDVLSVRHATTLGSALATTEEGEQATDNPETQRYGDHDTENDADIIRENRPHGRSHGGHDGRCRCGWNHLFFTPFQECAYSPCEYSRHKP